MMARQRLHREMTEEMQGHIDERAEALMAKGVPEEAARRQAALRFGNTSAIREEGFASRISPWLESILQDLRYAGRSVLKSPGLYVVSFLSLTLTVAANTALFSILNALLFRPLPVKDPETLISISYRIPGETRYSESASVPLYEQLREAAKGKAELLIMGFPNTTEMRTTPGGPIEHATVQHVSGATFPMLGVTPVLGRVLNEEDDQTLGAHPYTVLGYDYWQRRFGGDRGVLGRKIQYGETVYEIIGVARKGFFGTDVGKIVDIWVPASMYDRTAFTSLNYYWFRVFGRRHQDVSVETLTAALQPTYSAFVEERIKEDPGSTPQRAEQSRSRKLSVDPAASGSSGLRRQFREPVLLVCGVAALVLLIACANVAGLFLAKASRRAREMAMRTSLGAARIRLLRQMLTESALLGIAAACAGILLSIVLAPLLVSMISAERVPVRLVMDMDWRMALFCLGVSLGITLLFGLVPALQSSSISPAQAMKEGTAIAAPLLTGGGFVVIQVALAFVLVAVGLAFGLSFRNLLRQDLGFDQNNLLLAQFKMPSDSKEQSTSVSLWQPLRHRIEGIPGVEGVAYSNWPVFASISRTSRVVLLGKEPSQENVVILPVSDGYFSAMRTRLLAGRDFTEAEVNRATIPLCIVNEAFARRFLDTENAVGLRAAIFGEASPENEDRPYLERAKLPPYYREIVGVVGNVRYGSMREEPRPIIYIPAPRREEYTFLIRTKGTGTGLTAQLRESAAAVHPALELFRLETQSRLVDDTLIRERLLAGLGGAFGVLGLLLAAIGLYALLSFSVATRTKEIGVRMALGATQGLIIGGVWRSLFLLVGTGLLLGGLAAFPLLRTAESLLFGMEPADPVVGVGAALLFLGVALIAGTLPALHAARVNPTVALRYE